MVMQAEPVYCAYQAAVEKIGYRPRVIYVTPQGHVFHQRMAEEFAKEKDMIFCAVIMKGWMRGYWKRS